MSLLPDSIRRLQNAEELLSTFRSLSVCNVCLLRIAGETSPHRIRDSDQLLMALAGADGLDVKPLDVKPLGEAPCPCCFSVLQSDFCSEEFLKKVIDFVKTSGYTMNTFWCSLTLPNAADIRMRAFDEHWDQTCMDNSDARVRSRLSVKDAWKAIVTPVLSSAFAAKWIGHEGLEINLQIDHPEMDDECDPLISHFPKSFQEKRGPDGKMKRVVTRHALENLLKTVSSSEFKDLVKFPPKPLSQPATLTAITCLPCPVYVGGRYLKYSRNISQTPWFIEEERKGDISVEELICRKICDKFEAQSWRFMTSGREDIDVKCLGDGRPFGVELIGAKIAAASETDMQNLEDDINLNTDIAVRYLEVVSRSDMQIIKKGEEEKTKTYVARCQVDRVVTEQDIALLNSHQELSIKQKTPVRVLHRRANTERRKVIHTLSAKLLDSTGQFRLLLKTQAGTYIKEFIHGDFGRTEPSISSLLGQETECEELDVTAVDLVWPPSRQMIQ
ncbi:tRNA pseudouridine synthase Pus10-like [Paramacrobiotus metropolitanus]|uniref:tRNA pseudouridine synthase Pus10-like n=1 Tax=Paramacrobiotus metropolitanus TaxID=2943436 RepID=UPI002445F653|nr:tRNA pseudouridine synthase Pus10-like [Paramacrobiotus metropolitanus]